MYSSQQQQQQQQQQHYHQQQQQLDEVSPNTKSSTENVTETSVISSDVNETSSGKVPSLQQNAISPASTSTPLSQQQKQQLRTAEKAKEIVRGKANTRYMKGRLPDGVDFAQYPGRSSTPLPTAESKSAERINQLKIWNEAATNDDKRRLNTVKAKSVSLAGGANTTTRRTDSYKDAKDRHSASFHGQHPNNSNSNSSSNSNTIPNNNDNNNDNSNYSNNNTNNSLTTNSNKRITDHTYNDNATPYVHDIKSSKNDRYEDAEEEDEDDEEDDNNFNNDEIIDNNNDNSNMQFNNDINLNSSNNNDNNITNHIDTGGGGHHVNPINNNQYYDNNNQVNGGYPRETLVDPALDATVQTSNSNHQRENLELQQQQQQQQQQYHLHQSETNPAMVPPPRPPPTPAKESKGSCCTIM